MNNEFKIEKQKYIDSAAQEYSEIMDELKKEQNQVILDFLSEIDKKKLEEIRGKIKGIIENGQPKI
ncbi:MAG: hypothetical protein AUJ32_01140 [Parcubacteria group bacterium CG1_02_40_82]|uniref:Uncharacterized protein n=2 Tax=Candidatus Portnoyibacteriota TaxID=1817913 RepID=A0A2H0KU60_9BACT|nr:MAG: hypothetical protein AUJ32_01140 [Parcubacteria group bacterium CG1_02_40_82]PIQ75637.1 MAG: hypothetical protein COV84_00040 [Candidatus Portnoybacteria bacterium CG11_big_fil_rev_8_21_14_0_20_40_15]PJA64890.1 MAG: hypothetical protein CO159_00625 [Candidatus Portnoybacteria bacterium CG_4_9_14_3_um_filter_40_10]